MEQGNKIKLRNEVDRFGFSNIISKKLNYSHPPKSYANWLHGWFWADPEDRNLESKVDLMLGYPKIYNYNVPTVVHNIKLKNTLTDYGFTNVYCGGLPFIYTNKIEVKKKQDSLLVIMPHSLDYMNFSSSDMKNINNYLEKIYSFKKDFKHIDCLIFESDILKGTFAKLLKQYDFNLLVGAKPDHSNSLNYMRSIFEKYVYVTSCSLCSGLIYSMFCGGKPSIIEPIFEHSGDFFNTNPHIKKHNLVDVILYKESKNYLFKNYSYFIKNNPLDAIENISLANEIIGYEHKMDFEQIEKILSWKLLPKIKIIGQTFKRKLNLLT